MEFFETLRARRSIRAFNGCPVEAAKLEAILEAANRAPSAGNLQAYEIYATTDAKCRAALARGAGGQDFIRQAPAALVFCTHAARAAVKYGQRGMRLYAVQDAAISCTYAMLAAAALDLSTVWVGAFDPDAVREAVGAPDTLEPVAILPVGYAAEDPVPTARRPLAEIVHRI